VAHAYNPSHSGGRDQKDCCSKPAQANSLQDPISKKPLSLKRAGGVTQGEGLEFKSQYRKKKKKKLSWRNFKEREIKRVSRPPTPQGR
jgi:hypothetical protein